MQEELIQLKTKDNEYIALWKLYNNTSSSNQHVFLTHGTFSDKRICKGIAKYLIEKNFTCWIMEWRGHGASSIPKDKFNFETIGLKDIFTSLNYLTNTLNINNLNCVTHSGGGTCLSMCLVNNQQYISKIKSISFFGCQATGSANNLFNYCQIYSSKTLSRLVGYLPAKVFGLPHDETYYTMKQWYDWNLKKTLFGKNQADYYVHFPKIKIPILSIAGKGDTFIAPPAGCKTFLDAFQNPHNQFILCSKENGFAEDYNHSAILRSPNAKKEIYPIVLDWINKNFV